MKHIPVEAFPVVLAIEPIVMKYYPLFILFVVLVCVFNIVRARFFGRIVVNYPGGESVSFPKGTSVLEASRMGRIPHQSVCGGRGRCIRVSGFVLDAILCYGFVIFFASAFPSLLGGSWGPHYYYYCCRRRCLLLVV